MTQEGGADTGIKDYQYNYLSDNFKVVVMNFKSIFKNWHSHLETRSNNDR